MRHAASDDSHRPIVAGGSHAALAVYAPHYGCAMVWLQLEDMHYPVLSNIL